MTYIHYILQKLHTMYKQRWDRALEKNKPWEWEGMIEIEKPCAIGSINHIKIISTFKLQEIEEQRMKNCKLSSFYKNALTDEPKEIVVMTSRNHLPNL